MKKGQKTWLTLLACNDRKAFFTSDLFLYRYERDFMDSLNHENQADVIEAFNSTSRYLDDLLNIDNPYFKGMVNQIYPPELQLNKANTIDTEAPFFRFTSFYCKWICSF